MKIYIGADHRGYAMKEQIKSALLGVGHEVVDVSKNISQPNDDYTESALQVSQEVAQNTDDRGILFCGSGVGVDITANKIKGIRCGLGFSVDQVIAARNDDDINVLAIATDYVDEPLVEQIAQAFLITPFDHGINHERRIEKIQNLEI